MIVLDPHDGDLGMSAWVDCSLCSERPSWLHNPKQPGWFAIRAGEKHWIDRSTRHHYHDTCGLALVDTGQAVIRDLPMVKAVS